MTRPSAPCWFTSTYSGGSGTECVECARMTESILVRDSKVSSGPVLSVSGQAWHAFTAALRRGLLDG
ncbi:DUF397 domain-containing protein [Streptomyces fodineus]|uniref:DUF397 domain-containing protein n=1 Tax=Streptomyces fodineus TaxID=1904616 RepID=A0A1D7YER5_9ACTN|nr:DUF397 domain-containing protein [Streptomyces fodineus]AOR34061.1 DUF397 domain-containing protein [Streptomyces fodineus]